MRLILFKPDTYVDVDAVEAILPAQIPGMSRVLLKGGKEIRVEVPPMEVAQTINEARERES
jgi:hypothetical protein